MKSDKEQKEIMDICKNWTPTGFIELKVNEKLFYRYYYNENQLYALYLDTGTYSHIKDNRPMEVMEKINSIVLSLSQKDRENKIWLYEELNQTNMNLIDKAKTLFLKEPQKSFKKLGITGESEVPTDEGVKFFLSWLLQSNDPMVQKFYDEVVKPLVEEEKNEKK